VIIGTIPIAVLGVLFKHQIETVARNLWLVATTMVVFGVLLGLAEYYGRQKVELRQLKVSDGVILGFAQACALIPGVSRSGGTITAGLFLGLQAHGGGALLVPAGHPGRGRGRALHDPRHREGRHHPRPDDRGDGDRVRGRVRGDRWLLRWVAKHTVYAFVWYRLALGVLLFVALGAGWVSAT
jgi:undecaprenyl-diphosphatase